jgi:hypothetical protein
MKQIFRIFLVFLFGVLLISCDKSNSTSLTTKGFVPEEGFVCYEEDEMMVCYNPSYLEETYGMTNEDIENFKRYGQINIKAGEEIPDWDNLLRVYDIDTFEIISINEDLLSEIDIDTRIPGYYYLDLEYNDYDLRVQLNIQFDAFLNYNEEYLIEYFGKDSDEMNIYLDYLTLPINTTIDWGKLFRAFDYSTEAISSVEPVSSSSIDFSSFTIEEPGLYDLFIDYEALSGETARFMFKIRISNPIDFIDFELEANPTPLYLVGSESEDIPVFCDAREFSCQAEIIDTYNPSIVGIYPVTVRMTTSFAQVDETIYVHVNDYASKEDFIFEEGVIKEYIGTSEFVVIPEEIDGITVTKIDNWAFKEKELKGVILPNSLETIGVNAFQSNDIYELVIPDSVMYMGTQAFIFNDIHVLTLSSKSLTGDGELFFDNPIQQVILKGEINNYLDYWKVSSLPLDLMPGIVFENGFYFNPETRTIYDYDPSYGLEVIIPETILETEVNRIAHSAMADYDLLSIVFPSTLKYIGISALERNKFTEIIIPEGVEIIEQQAFLRNLITAVTISSTVLEIWGHAFAYNDNIQEVTIYGDVTRFNSDWERIGFPIELMPN